MTFGTKSIFSICCHHNWPPGGHFHENGFSVLPPSVKPTQPNWKSIRKVIYLNGDTMTCLLHCYLVDFHGCSLAVACWRSELVFSAWLPTLPAICWSVTWITAFLLSFKVSPSSETSCQWRKPSSSGCSESTLTSTTSTSTQSCSCKRKPTSILRLNTSSFLFR